MSSLDRSSGDSNMSAGNTDKDLRQLASEFFETFFKDRRKDRRANYIKTVFIALAVLVPVGFYAFILQGGLNGNDSGSLSQEIYDSFELSADGDKNGSAKVFVVPVEGIISGTSNTIESNNSNMVVRVKNMFDEIEKTDNVEAVILYINSPGGTVVASDQIYEFILDWKKRAGIPVYSHFGRVAASGGYYIAQATDEITAGEHTVTGSIGVVLRLMNYQRLMEEKLGVKVYTFTSGEYKDTGSPFREMRDDEERWIQKRIEKSFNEFVQVVAQGRKHVLTKNEVLDLADGRIFDGDRAEALGLVDGISPFSETIRSRAETIADSRGYGTVKIVRYTWTPPGSSGGLLFKLGRVLGLDLSDGLTKRLAASQEFIGDPMYLWEDGISEEILIP